MNIDYKSIADEVSAKGYADYETAFAAMSAEDVESVKDIETADIKKYLILTDKWLAIKVSTDISAVVTMDALNIFETFKLTDPVTGAMVKAKLESMIDALIASSLLVAADKTAIIGMGVEVKPKWPELQGDPVKKIGIVASAIDKRRLGEI